MFSLNVQEIFNGFFQNYFIGTLVIAKHESQCPFIYLFNFSKRFTTRKHPYKGGIIKV